MKEISKDLNYYLSLPYSIEILRDDDEENPGWVAKVKDLPGCITQADSFEELGEMVEDAKRSWIKVALEDGISIPEPRIEEDYSGKFVVRLPKSLHRELAELSDREEVSLNTLVLNLLAKSVGMISQTLKKENEEHEPGSIFAWPSISESAKRLLLQHGLGKEVQEINENMFAGWIAEHIYQAQAAIEQKDNRTALRYFQKIGQTLEVFCGQSPLIKSLCYLITIIESQILANISLLKGMYEHEIIRQKINSQVISSSQSLLSLDKQYLFDTNVFSNRQNYFFV